MSEIDPKFTTYIKPSSTDFVNPEKKTPLTGQKDFDRILNQQFKSDENEPVESPSKGLPELDGIFKTPVIEDSFDIARISKKLDVSLEQLDLYAAWLNDPAKSLKETRSLLDELSDQTALFFSKIEPHLNDHPELAELFARLRTTVETEKIKFDRGDYL